MAQKLRSLPQSGYGYPEGSKAIHPSPIIAARTPATSDTGYVLGQLWVNTASNTIYGMTGCAAGSAVWSLCSPGASDVDTINSLSPVAGDILIAGGTNLTVVNGGHTVTLNLDNAIALATSVTSPIYTAAADLAINAHATDDVIIKLGDDAGANKLSVTNLSGAEVWALDSTGSFGTLLGLTVTGALTQTAGAVNIGQDNAANAVNIAGGTTARAVGIANSAAAHTVTLGSATGAASLLLRSGTGNLAATSTDAITLDSAGVLELNSSAGVIGIGNDAVAQNINVGTGAAARTITIGNISGATAVNVNTGTGGSTYTTTNGTLGFVTGTGAINVGADAAAKTITVGNITGATAVNINTGTGGSTYTTTNGAFALNTGTGTIGVGTDAAAKTITIGNATGATSVVLNSGTGAIDVGTNAVAHTVTVGSTTGAAGTVIQSGTGDVAVTSTDAITADAVGVLELNSSGAAIGIGNDADAFGINIGTGAAARTVTVGNATGATSVVVNAGTGAASFGANATAHTTTIGSTTGASATVIQSGTGDITVTGTVKEVTSEFLTRSGDYITFQTSPVLQSTATTGAAPTGTTGATNLMLCQEGVILEQFILGAGQTIIAPRMDANGLLVSLDLTVGEGAEYNFGAARANSRHAFTIGTSPAFFFELRFRINDMDGAAPYIFGFRKSEANNATFSDYSDYCGIGMNAATSATSIVIYDELNGGGQTITNTTDLWGGDGTVNTLKVLVSSAGVVTYTINGVAPTATHALTFDNADVVVPYIRIEHSASPTEVDLVWMKIGYQE